MFGCTVMCLVLGWDYRVAQGKLEHPGQSGDGTEGEQEEERTFRQCWSKVW